jgi:putative ABC transport system permease protein
MKPSATASNAAKRPTLREFGNVGLVKEVTREMWGWVWLERFGQDIKYGIRVLFFKHPRLTALMVTLLAFGIGGSSMIFSVANAALFKPLPFKDPDRLAIVWEMYQGKDIQSFAVANYVDVRDQNQVFEQTAMLIFPSLTITGGNEPERVSAIACSSGLFSVLGVNLAMGRAFTPEEEQLGKHRVAVLSHGFWQRRFAGVQDILGKEVQVNGAARTIIGVLPKDFTFPLTTDEPELWIPLVLSPDAKSNRSTHYVRVLARLKPGVTINQANENLRSIALQLQRQYPEMNHERDIKAVPLQQQVVGDIKPMLLMLLGATALVLLIACANVANLLLSRVSVRQKEVAIRAALGASRMRIFRQLLTESLLLSLLGGGVGLLLAVLGSDVIGIFEPSDIPRVVKAQIDVWALAFAVAVSVLTGVIFGLAPAAHASKTNLNCSLKEGGARVSTGIFSRRTRSVLVVAEVALSMILLIAAGLIIRSFLLIQEVKPGFQSQNVLTMELSLPSAKYGEGQPMFNFYQQVLEKLSSIPGAESVSAVNNLPLNGGTSTAFVIEGKPAPAHSGDQMTEYRVISPDYFRTMAIPLLKGRYFTSQDIKGAVGVTIVNQALVDRYFPGEEPLGKRLIIDIRQKIPREIVGVVGNVKHYGLDASVQPESYVPLAEDPWRGMNFALRTNSDPSGLAATVRRAVLSVDKDMPVYDIKTMDQRIAASFSQRRSQVFLITLFAALAFLMAVVGVYSVISHSVSQRVQELGIRIALGAQPSDILKLVFREGLLLCVVGLAIGLAGTFAFNRLLANLLFGVSAIDPIVFISVPLVLMLASLSASYVPARRATRVDPTIALRYE